LRRVFDFGTTNKGGVGDFIALSLAEKYFIIGDHGLISADFRFGNCGYRVAELDILFGDCLLPEKNGGPPSMNISQPGYNSDRPHWISDKE